MMIPLNDIVTLLSLTALEVVLAIDNIIFLSILVSKLPPEQQGKARFLGLLGAMLSRILLLLSLFWVSHLTNTLWSWGEYHISGRTLILFFGGLFLLFKSTQEVYETLEKVTPIRSSLPQKKIGFWGIIFQIGILDIVFSLDSVLTAIGMSDVVYIMVTSIVLSIFVMMFFAKAINTLIQKYPSIKILALSFLMLVGVALVADALGHHIPRTYIYFSMLFSLIVEALNIRLRQKN